MESLSDTTHDKHSAQSWKANFAEDATASAITTHASAALSSINMEPLERILSKLAEAVLPNVTTP